MPSVFFLTGSSRGLGRAIAEAVLDGGHQLVATARDPRSLDDLVALHGDRILALALDVTDARRGRRGDRRRGRALRTNRRRRQQRRLRRPGGGRGRHARGLPQADRHQPVRRRQCHQGRASGAARAGGRTHHSNLVDRRAPRDPRAVGLPVGQMGGRGLLERARRRGRAARDSRDRARARRDGDRLGRLVDAGGTRVRAVSPDRRRERRDA